MGFSLVQYYFYFLRLFWYSSFQLFLIF